MDVIKYLSKKNHETVDKTFYQLIQLWRDWYRGEADFHSYKVYNGEGFVGVTRRTLGMAKKIAEDKADLLLNEKVEINMANNTLQDFIDQILEDNNFWVRGNQLVELSQALGTGAFVEYLENDEIKMDFIPADCVYPLSWDNGRITECAFASQIVEKGKKYTYVNIHTKGENGVYVVENVAFDKDGKEQELEGVESEWNTQSTVPMFQILTPNLVNNVDYNNPLGVSIYANAIPILEGVDLVYDSYDNEFQLGKKRIFVDGSLVKVDYANGQTQPVFDTKDTTFYSLPMGSDESKNEPIKESNMEIRAEEHEIALQNRLNILSSKCGFGQHYYQFDKTGVKTATEVISENSQLFKRIKKDEIILDRVLRDMVRAILFLGGKSSEEEISIAFDDSIIEDTEAISQRAMLELQSGIIDNVVYYQRVYGFTEEQAIKFDQDIKKRSPAPPDMNFFPGGDGGDE